MGGEERVCNLEVCLHGLAPCTQKEGQSILGLWVVACTAWLAQHAQRTPGSALPSESILLPV